MNFKILCCSAALAISFCAAPWSFSKEPAAPTIFVAGQAEGEGGAAKQQAVQAAEQKAVRQALARMITPDADKESLFQQITVAYRSYLKGKTKVVKVQEKNGRTTAFCNVPVDFGLLKQRLSSDIKALQESDAHSDDEAFFVVRVTGITDRQELQRGQAEVLNFYTDAFQEYGFQKGVADDVLIAGMKKYEALPVQDYMQAMTRDVQQNVAVSLAVIGEIRLEPSVTDDSGTNSTCTSHIVVVYNSPDGKVVPIGTFEDTYTLRRASKAEAEKLVLQKAAYNSAKYLSHVTVSYWERNP